MLLRFYSGTGFNSAFRKELNLEFENPHFPPSSSSSGIPFNTPAAPWPPHKQPVLSQRWVIVSATDTAHATGSGDGRAFIYFISHLPFLCMLALIFLFFPVGVACKTSWKLKSSKSLSHRSTWNASSKAPPLILWFRDITTSPYHRFSNVCLSGSGVCELTNQSRLGIWEGCAGANRQQTDREKLMCLLSIEAWKPILYETLWTWKWENNMFPFIFCSLSPNSFSEELSVSSLSFLYSFSPAVCRTPSCRSIRQLKQCFSYDAKLNSSGSTLPRHVLSAWCDLMPGI